MIAFQLCGATSTAAADHSGLHSILTMLCCLDMQVLICISFSLLIAIAVQALPLVQK